MSAFLSDKFLKYRAALAGGKIEQDLACRTCGYNVRGLTFGRNCPECGQMIEFARGLHDVLTEGTPEERARWRLGLGAAAACLAAVVGLRVAVFVSMISGGGTIILRSYVMAGFVISVIWTAAAWLITPPTLDVRWPRLAGLRRTVRVTQLLWVPAYVLLVYKHLGTPTLGQAGMIDGVTLLARGVAGLGVLALAGLLSFLAREAELDSAATRLERAIAWIALFTLLVVAFIAIFGGAVPWIMLLFLIPMLVGWTWFMTLMTLGVWEMYQHVEWTRRHAAGAIGRTERIATTRRELEERANTVIRPVPAKSSEDLPFDARDESD